MEVRHLTAEDHLDWQHMFLYSFSYTQRYTSEISEKFSFYNPEQAIGVFVDGQLAAVGYKIKYKQNIRGKIYDMGGIAAVSSYPEFRRRGYARMVMEAHFNEMRKQGQKVSILYPFKQEFYERMGYAVIGTELKVRIPIKNIRSYMDPVEYQRYDRKEGFEVLREFHREKIVPNIHGMIDRSDARWKRKQVDPGVVMTASIDDEIVAAASYTISGYQKDMKSEDFFWSSVQGREAGFGWAARHIDQVKALEIPYNIPENIYYWVDNFKGKLEIRDYPMARIIDLNILDGIVVPSDARSGVIEVVDHFCQWNNKKIRLVEDDGKLRIEEVEDEGELVQIQAIAAALYGAVGPGELINKGWTTPEGEKLLLSFFPKQDPFLWELF